MLAVYESATTNILPCGGTTALRIPVIPISHDEYNLNIGNPYKNPWTDGTQGIIWRLENRPQSLTVPPTPLSEYKIHGLITDGSFNITKYYLRYLKKPEDINVDNITPANQSNSELADFTHQAICDIAVKLLSAAVREQIPINQLTADMLE